MKKYIVILVVLIASEGFAQDLNIFFNKADTFFKANVTNGKVAYDAINKNQDALNEVLKIAEGISVTKEDANNYQAFWINAYNLSVIKGDNAGFFDKTKHNLGGKQITLNDIEHKLLRAKFKDARFHFVLVCGAVGCPPLINKAYKPNTLNAQLEAQTKKAINGSFIKVDDKKKRIKGSKILEWYKEDFTMNGTTEIDFLNKYRTNKIPDNYKLSYFEYNWKLNKQ